ncbi:hypothetical protein [Clostridium aminobutyricum]|uniref:DUF5659 domain-containing protein n=1 Tax=Clostridium aminobutyricum TaxID=33953 RepID=A0A939IGF6_CLOAM|nr:hypothetical protein [Clostridium aminobutyricum]MBN7771837.1 hypothetical protein [Clostridium aminobutyricum]
MNKFYNINKKYLAEALSFLGFRYYKYINDEGKQVYSFEDSNEFQEALSGLFALKGNLQSN